MLGGKIVLITILICVSILSSAAFCATAMTPIRLLYPSFSGSWATAWIAKEAGYFSAEGLDIELIRVSGSTRMVAAMLGGSAPIIQAGAIAAQQRDTALRFMRAFTRGMQRYRTDKEFSKKILGKYGKITDDEILEGAWQDYAPTLQKSPRLSLKGIQFMIENQFPGKKPLPKPEQFVDLSIADQLERSGFVDSVNK